MPIKVKRKDGTTSTIKNSVYLPAYYLIPKELLENNCKEILKIPRIPIKALSTYESIELIESDFFLEVIIDMYAYMVWNCLYPQVYLEIYSGYDPIWKLVHQAPIWIKLLIDERIIFTVEQLCKWSNSNREIEMDFVSLEEATLIMNYIVAKYIVQNNFREIIKVIEENRCEEDFDFRNSRQKTDFLRKWYHTRTNHPSISLEEWQENYKEKHNGIEYEIADDVNVENDVVDQIIIDEFLSTLSDKDRRILELRIDGTSYERIAELLGYKNHSGVIKRIQKIGVLFQKYTGKDFGYKMR